MKKTALLPAGIVAATILVIMGLGILMTGSFYFMPTISIDPFSGGDVDENGMLVLTGTTNLGLDTYLLVNISAVPGQVPPGPGAGFNKTALASVVYGTGGTHSWRAVVNASALPPGDYELRVSTVTFSDDYRSIPGQLYAAERFTLGSPATVINRTGKEPFIRPNPAGDTIGGDRIEITGTTNLGPGTELIWSVEPSVTNESVPGTGTTAATGARDLAGSTAVVPGIEGINRWSFAVNMSGMPSARYTVLIITGDTASGNITANTASARSDFVFDSTLPGRVLPAPGRFITIDFVPDLPVNTRTVITGTTTLPAGEDLQIEVNAVFNTDYEFIVNPDDMAQGAVFMGMMAGTTVVRGPEGIGLWAMDLDTYSLQAGRYGVNVSNSRMNMTTRRIEPGDVFSTQNFTVMSGGGRP